jgi:hypothetical protein
MSAAVSNASIRGKFPSNLREFTTSSSTTIHTTPHTMPATDRHGVVHAANTTVTKPR